jgi:hypothetical protein
VGPDTPFTPGLHHGELLLRLQRLNRSLEWDHRTEVVLPLGQLHAPELRAALWSLLYAGGHALLVPEAPAWDPGPFAGFWED